jgi:hypothetical protein
MRFWTIASVVFFAIVSLPLLGLSQDYPQAVWVPAAPNNYVVGNRGVGDIDTIIIHTTQSSTARSTIEWFQNNCQHGPEKNPSCKGVSAHYLIDQDGKVYQMVKEKDYAQHAGKMNTRSIGIEHVGWVNQPGWATDAMYQASAALVSYLADKYNIPKDRSHIIGHNEVLGTTHSDPGPYWDWNYFMQLVLASSPGLENYLTSYLSQGWNFIWSTVGPISLGEISGCNFDSTVWQWSWNDRQWYQVNAITPFAFVALHVTSSCTARVPGTPQSVTINFFQAGWWIFSSTKSWNQITGSCRLVSGPMYYTESGMVTISSTEAMDGFKAYFVEVSDMCTTNSIASLTSATRPTGQGAPMRIAKPGVLKNLFTPPKLDQSEFRVRSIVSVATKDRARFRVQGSGITSIQVRIFDLSGKQVFDSPETLGTTLDWHYRSSSVANGVYLYVVTVRDTEGRKVTSKIHKLVILR